MRFTIIYPNLQETRDAIFAQLIPWSKQVDLSKKEINGGSFKISSGWPSEPELRNIPTNLQIEEVFIENDKINSIRKLVVDVESEKIVEPVMEQVVAVKPLEEISQPKVVENVV